MPNLFILNFLSGKSLEIRSLFCKLRKRNTTIEYCEKCTLKVAHTTKKIVKELRDIFEKEEFYSAFSDLEKARSAIRDGNNELAITYSTTMLESTMRIIHEKLNMSLPSKTTLTDLYKSTRTILKINDLDSENAIEGLANSVGGVITNLGHVRNSLSESHGSGSIRSQVASYIAELLMNSCSTLATFFVRRYKEIKEAAHG